MNQELIIRTIAEGVAPHLPKGVFYELMANLMKIEALEGDLMDYAVDYYDKVTEGEDID